MAESDTFDIRANHAANHAVVDRATVRVGDSVPLTQTSDALTLISTGTYSDSAGASHCIYPHGHTWWPERHHHYYPWPAPQPQTLIVGSTASPEKPHETVQRAMQEIATATRELARSAKEIGVPVDQRALEEALIEKLREAL